MSSLSNNIFGLYVVWATSLEKDPDLCAGDGSLEVWISRSLHLLRPVFFLRLMDCLRGLGKLRSVCADATAAPSLLCPCGLWATPLSDVALIAPSYFLYTKSHWQNMDMSDWILIILFRSWIFWYLMQSRH